MRALAKSLFSILLSAVVLGHGPTAGAEPPAGALPRATGQSVYVPVYSSIRHLNDTQYSLAVTISIRNIDPERSLKVTSAHYYDNHGDPVRNFLAEPRHLPGFGSMELFIPQAELRGDTGSNFLIHWEADAPALPPLIEAVMVGSRGAGGIAFTSRGVAIGP